MKKKVYVSLSADVLHEGHINIIKTASKYGYLIIGLLTDEAISSYRRLPHLNYKQREYIVKNIKYVDEVIPQKSLDHTSNLIKIKPDYVVHGDDWKSGILKETRKQVLKTLKRWGGVLIEPKYTKNISSKKIKEKIIKLGTTPDIRRSKLKRLLNSKKLIRVLEAHNPISGMIIENLQITKSGKLDEFDGMWSSSLTDSVSRGMPDNQSVDYSTRINGISEIFNVTTKPLIFDIDNGGQIDHLKFVVKKLDSLGVSALIMEDKIGLKKNSLFKDQSNVKQDTINNFTNKIKKAKNSLVGEDFLIISRIESLILNKPVSDALKRAIAYSKAGADCIMIHSKDKDPKKIFEFSKKFLKTKHFKPLIAVPSSYSKTYEKQLIENGFKIVIYANHMLRAAHASMIDTAKKILIHNRGYEAEKNITSIKDIIELVEN